MYRLVAASSLARVTSFTAVPGTDVTHVELWAPRVASKFTAGQFALINISNVSRNAWHPFTINVSGDVVTLLCKSEKGWTNQLRTLAALENHSAPTAQIVGPYGGIDPRDYTQGGPVFLAAGGIGITPVISVFSDALRRAVPNVTLLWCIRSSGYLELPFVKGALAAAAGHSRDVTVIVQFTQAKQTELPVSPAANISYKAGRPDIEALIREAANDAVEHGFAFACGPVPMQDEVLRVSKQLGFGKSHIETFLL